MYKPTIYLASKSPGRKKLLENAGYKPKVIVSKYEENNNESINPLVLVTKHAEGKAKDVTEILKEKNIKEGLVIGADTIGVIDNKVLGKPKDINNAKTMLKSLSGRSHTVYSGVCVINLKNMHLHKFIEQTDVTFRKLTPDDIEWYIKNDNPLGKAAGYSIQERGIRLVKNIHGDFNNIIGLPMISLITVIESFKNDND